MFWQTRLPTKVPTDTVLPFRFFDDAPIWKGCVVYATYVFDDVLDAEKLRMSLEAVIQRDGWQKLGARLRKNDDGNLEYHIPAEFTADRPPLAFPHISHNGRAKDHPVAFGLPKPTAQRPKLVGDPGGFKPLYHPDGGPTKPDDYLKRDIPQLGLHVVTFSDKTILTLHWPHTLMDAMAKRAVVDAWLHVLHGEPDKMASPIGPGSDPLAELGRRPTEPYKHADRQLGLLSLAGYGVSNILSFTASLEDRMMCIPAPYMASLRERAVDDLAGLLEGERPGFLSDNDILVAWFTRLAIAEFPPTDRTLVLNLPHSLRRPLSGDLLPPEKGPYISNAIGFIPVMTTVRDVLEKPLGHTAAVIHRAVQELGARAQIEAVMNLWRESTGRIPAVFGDRGMQMIFYTSWHKARLFDMDFSPAVVGVAGGKRTGAGRPNYVQACQFGVNLPDGYGIMGKDGQGNYWMSGTMTKGRWAAIEEQVARGD